jgi:hypothetical protein
MQIKKIISISFFLFIILSFSKASPSIQVADGWRLPNPKDMTGAWSPFLGNKELPYLACADFNGDGISDDAYIALAQKGSKWALFVNLNLNSGKPRIIKLEEDSSNTPPQNMGVSLVSPGRYKTACGKGYWNCKKGEPSELNLNLHAINLYMSEGSNSFFWWEKNTGKFVQTWISD